MPHPKVPQPSNRIVVGGSVYAVASKPTCPAAVQQIGVETPKKLSRSYRLNQRIVGFESDSCAVSVLGAFPLPQENHLELKLVPTAIFCQLACDLVEVACPTFSGSPT
jgi:uncharacterized protein (DUF169 family)